MVTDFIFLGSKITVNGDWSHELKRGFLLGKKVMANLDSILKSRDITWLTEGGFFLLLLFVCFFSSHVWMWELDRKEGWALKNWYFQIVVLEKTLESLLDCKEIKPINPRGNQTRIFTERTVAKAEAPMLWLPISYSTDMNLSKLQEIVKDKEAWSAAIHGGHKESDMTEWLNSNSIVSI